MSLAKFAVLGFFFSAFSAHADQYFYGAITASCSAHVTSQEIGTDVLSIGRLNPERVAYAYLRIEQGHNQGQNLIVAKCEGTCPQVAFLQNGRIPNFFASENYPLSGATDQATHTLSFVGGRGLSVNLNLEIPILGSRGVPNPQIIGFTPSNLDLTNIHAMIVAAGANNVPNFVVHPPTVRNLHHSSTVELELDLRYRSTPGNLAPAGLSRIYQPLFSYQISYPPHQFNGLSYHVNIECGQ